MRVRPIHFIETQAQRCRVSTKEGRDAPGVLTGLREGFNIGKASKRLGCVQLQGFESTRPGGGKHERGLSNSRRTMQEKHGSIGWGSKIGLKALLHIGMSNHLIETLGTPGFAPHT